MAKKKKLIDFVKTADFKNLESALNDKSTTVQRETIEAIMEYGGSWAEDLIIDVLNDFSSFVRDKAIVAVEKIGKSKKAMEALIEIVRSETDRRISQMAATAIMKMKVPGMVELFVKSIGYLNIISVLLN